MLRILTSVIVGRDDMPRTMIFLRGPLHSILIEFLDDYQRKLYRTARRVRIRSQNRNVDFEGILSFLVVGCTGNVAESGLVH